jgi:hypothetical protein
MNATTRFHRTFSLIVLACASFGANAQANSVTPVWIENQSFGFEACAALAKTPTAEDAQGTLAALRSSAIGDLNRAAQMAGVALGNAKQLSMTPVSGSFACGASHSEATFRVAAVDRVSGKYWSADIKMVGEDAAPTPATVATLADSLARNFGGAIRQASLR